MATLGNIQAKIAKLQAQAEALVQKESSGALEKIHGLMQKHGITMVDIESFIGGKTRGRKSASVVPKQSAGSAKYRDPKTGATWTGHGRAPAWIANAKDRTKFLVEETTAKSARAASTTAKAGSYVRGPQPPKYRDPKSGATWSGRGRAPAWLAGAKDLSKFLIEVGDDAASTAKPTVTKKTSATRKAAVKKTGTKKKTAIKKPATSKAVQAVKTAPAKKTSVKNTAAKTAPAKRSSRQAERSVVTDDVAIASANVVTENVENF